MHCLTCAGQRRVKFLEGDRVTLSGWEQSMLNKEMRGRIVEFGHPNTRRVNTAKIVWDNGHHDQWWPITMLYREHEPPTGGE